MHSIFTNYIAMDNFCYELVSEWVEYRKQKSLPFTLDDYYEWLDEFEGAMENAYEDYIADERL